MSERCDPCDQASDASQTEASARLSCAKTEDEVLHVGDTGARVVRRGDTVQKTHRAPGSYARELRNYQWLDAQGFSASPRLLAFDDDTLTLVLEFVTPWSAMSDARRRSVLPTVGTALARLHALGAERTDSLPLADALRARVRAARRALRGADFASVRLVCDEFEGLDLGRMLRHETRAMAHRDFRPRNWAFAESRNQAVLLDWEHARPDFVAVDFARLDFALDDAQRAALETSYERVRPLPPVGQRRLAVRLHLVQTLAWAHRNGVDTHRSEAAWLLQRPELWRCANAE